MLEVLFGIALPLLLVILAYKLWIWHWKIQVHKFVQRLVPLFERQRSQNYQFAVLFLTHKRNFTSIQFRTRFGKVVDPDEATDNSHATFPDHQDQYNYIVARPDGLDHAEALLVNQFDQLLSNYQSSPCQTAVLYTWLLPCENCTREIISRLGQGRSSMNVTLIYTSKMQYVTADQEQEIVSKLEKAGISVIQEGYDKYLPPVAVVD